jgi:hypothetical protein
VLVFRNARGVGPEEQNRLAAVFGERASDLIGDFGFELSTQIDAGDFGREAPGEGRDVQTRAGVDGGGVHGHSSSPPAADAPPVSEARSTSVKPTSGGRTGRQMN